MEIYKTFKKIISSNRATIRDETEMFKMIFIWCVESPIRHPIHFICLPIRYRHKGHILTNMFKINGGCNLICVK